MAIQLQLRKGTKVQNDAFTGAEGELTYDTDSKGLRVHDGQTPGGHMIDTVAAWQIPTAENNYSWYRKYASGWVEQGGIYNAEALTYLIPMADTNYTMFLQPMDTSGKYAMNCQNLTTTGASINTAASQWHNYSWRVSGMAAQNA